MADEATIAEMLARYGEGAPMTEARPDPSQGPEYLRRGMYGEALFSANLLLASMPPGSEVAGVCWRVRGEALFGLRRFVDASVAFERAAELGGDAARGITQRRALCLVELRRIGDAQRLILAEMHARDVDPDELLQLQQLLVALHAQSPTPPIDDR